MKRLGLDLSLSLSLYVYFAAALTITVAQDNVYYKCKDFKPSGASHFNFTCDAGKVIIVKSAIVGATDIFNPPEQCPTTNNTCLKEITAAADLCTWRNECVISQNIQLNNELQLPCPRNGNTVANFIHINYTCVVPVTTNYGDICHFDGDLYSNSAVYISSYPNFPGAMGNDSYRCSCLLTSSSSSANVSLRALLVKLTSAATCSERLSIIDSKADNKLTFCSPCNNVNNVTTVPLASDPVVILFQRDSDVSPYNGKFILEITGPSSGTGSIGRIKCGLDGSTMSSLTNITKASPSYFSTTTTRAILSQPNGFSSTNIQNTSSGMTVISGNMSTSAEHSILPSSKPASETPDASVATLISDDRPTLASQTDSDKKSLSTGAIIGIVLGVIGFLAVLSLVILFATKNLRSKRNRPQSTELMPSASDPRLDRSSVDKNPQYETTIEGNGLQVNQPKISKLPNMQENQDHPEHSYYNGSISNITPLPDNHDHYEPLRVTDNQQQTYYNQPSENSNYQPLNFS